jgi:hypothetical protein
VSGEGKGPEAKFRGETPRGYLTALRGSFERLLEWNCQFT